MKIKRALFIGHYPNAIEPYLRSFFRNLVETIADQQIECYVIAPVSVTKYRQKIKTIPKSVVEYSPNGNPVQVYHPRYLSYSSKKIGPINTGRWTEHAFQKSALLQARKLKIEFDFVYGHFFLGGGLAAVKIGNQLNIPSFIAFGECDYESQVRQDFGDLKKNEIQGLTGIVSVSTQNAKFLEQLEIFKEIPVLIAPNAINTKLFYKQDRIECRKKLGLDIDKFIVGFVGGFIERKGDKRLLKAVEELPNIYVAFAGKGENPPMGEKVVFCQPMIHDEIPIFLNAVDIFCLPTLSEGSCNAIVEAAACEIPIISSDLSFNDDLLTDSNSIKINPTSVEQIKEAIKGLHEDVEKRNALVLHMKQDVKKFNIERRANIILDFINQYIR